MLKITHNSNRNFRILNLTDPQLDNSEWEEHHQNGEIFKKTVETLVERVQPDLITISGDLSYAGCYESYKNYGAFFDAFQIPWTCCFGNHDNQGGDEPVQQVLEGFLKCKYFIFEKCDLALGNSNFVLLIEKNGIPAEGIILMDTHDKMGDAWAKLLPNQLEWYEKQVEGLKALGCKDTTLITHIPIYAYRDAAKAAFKNPQPDKLVTLENSYGTAPWNEGYEDSFGVYYEDICSCPEDEGALELICKLGSTKNILCGHDHVNNWVVTYRGVRFIYATKTGPGCYWDPKINGGTVIDIDEQGVQSVRHEYVDVSK